MKDAKEKDRVLAQIKAYRPHDEIVGLEKHLDALIKDEYVSGSFTTDGSIIVVRITPKGKRFLKNGGYSAQSRSKLRKALLSPIGRIVEGVIVAVLIIIAGWLLKERYGISDSPECTEQKALKNDSTSLSSASQSRLNEDSAARRGNPRELSLDNSESTFESADTGTPARDMSAEHSSTIDESKPTPSGR